MLAAIQKNSSFDFTTTLIYNNFMSVELLETERATLAAQWCQWHKINYDLEYLGWPSNTRYRFIFDTEEDLVMFTLKWK